MAKVTVCLDPGSCHMGKIEYAIELLDLAVHVGADYIKFQMGVKYPNIDVPYEWWPILRERAKDKIGITASTFTAEAYEFMLAQNPPFMKFAYSRNNAMTQMWFCLDAGIKTVVSCDVMSLSKMRPECVKLFCVPEYPVKYKIDFEGLFPMFDGFSDHTLGTQQTMEALRYGAKWIEKHFTLDHPDINCPDHSFALKPDYLCRMMIDINQYEGEAVCS